MLEVWFAICKRCDRSWGGLENGVPGASSAGGAWVSDRRSRRVAGGFFWRWLIALGVMRTWQVFLLSVQLFTGLVLGFPLTRRSSHARPSTTPVRRPRIGSLFSGYGGLDLAVEHVTGGETVWFSEINAPVARLFAGHWSEAPNLGDITAIDWSQTTPIDVLCGGFPARTSQPSAKAPASPQAQGAGSGRTWPPRSRRCAPNSW